MHGTEVWVFDVRPSAPPHGPLDLIDHEPRYLRAFRATETLILPPQPSNATIVRGLNIAPYSCSGPHD